MKSTMPLHRMADNAGLTGMERSGMSEVETIVIPSVGERWCLKSNESRVAVVVGFDDLTDPEWPNWIRGHVQLKAPWYRNGEGGKSLNSFLKQFKKV